jgi:hypothetical protein
MIFIVIFLSYDFTSPALARCQVYKPHVATRVAEVKVKGAFSYPRLLVVVVKGSINRATQIKMWMSNPVVERRVQNWRNDWDLQAFANSQHFELANIFFSKFSGFAL